MVHPNTLPASLYLPLLPISLPPCWLPLLFFFLLPCLGPSLRSLCLRVRQPGEVGSIQHLGDGKVRKKRMGEISFKFPSFPSS